MIQSLTDIADEAVILPVIVVAALGLVLTGQRRTALAWTIIAPGTLFAVLVAKLSVAACGGFLPTEWRLHSPSGHTAAAAVVFGGLAALLFRWPRRPFNALLYAFLMAILTGWSRLALGVHSPAEVLVGGLIGIIGAVAIVVAARPGQQPFRSPMILIGVVGLAVVILHGRHFDAESHISRIAPTLWPLRLCRL